MATQSIEIDTSQERLAIRLRSNIDMLSRGLAELTTLKEIGELQIDGGDYAEFGRRFGIVETTGGTAAGSDTEAAWNLMVGALALIAPDPGGPSAYEQLISRMG